MTELEPLDRPKWFPANKVHKGFLAYFKHPLIELYGDLNLLWHYHPKYKKLVFTDYLEEYLADYLAQEKEASRREFIYKKEIDLK